MGWEVPLWTHTWVPGAQQHLETGRTSKKVQRGAGRWSARITESRLLCHDVDALGKYQHFTAQRFSAAPRTQRQGHFIPFFLCLLNSNT